MSQTPGADRKQEIGTSMQISTDPEVDGIVLGEGGPVLRMLPAERSGQGNAMPLVDIPAVDTEDIPPHPGGVINALSRIGYSLHEALADIIDNSVDARGAHVLVRFFRDDSAVRRIVVADDGSGMAEDVLSEAMQFGARMQHEQSDLGKFGLGLKSASFSQCRTLSVLTRQNGRASGRRWRVALIERGWICEKLDPAAVGEMLDQDWGPVDTTESGSLIIWDDLDRLDMGKRGVNAALDRYMRRLPTDLGLTYHRMLQAGTLSLTLDTEHLVTGVRGAARSVDPMDPFGYRRSGKVGYPCLFELYVSEGPSVPLTAHIWPANAKTDEYKLGGGKVAARQGFYFYRNDRLIQAGGWNGWRDHDAEPHSSLARVAVDLPTELDSQFGLNVQKSRVDTPPTFIPALERARSGVTTFADYMRDAVEVYRAGDLPDDTVPLTLGAGVPSHLRTLARRRLADGALTVREIPFSWEELDEEEFVRIDRDGPSVVLNRRYRSSVLYGTRGGGADAPLVKTLLFFALHRDMDRRRDTAGYVKMMAELNAMLVAAAKAQDL